MPAFDQLQRASFEGIEFPVMAVTVTGEIRDHVHEYPHANGGAPEKMGRRLYEIKMDATFQSTFRGYPGLWPNGLQKLREHFEDQTTGDLVIPTIGKIQAYCKRWTQQQVKGVLSGEHAQFEFKEDQSTDALAAANQVASVRGVLAKDFTRFNSAAALAAFASEKDIGIFDLISNAVNAVLAIGDQVDAAGSLITSKLLTVANIINQFDHTPTVKDYFNYPLIRAVNDMGETVGNALNATQANKLQAFYYIVPVTMPMNSISTVIYGDTSHTVDLMTANEVDDVFAVPAGTRIRYFSADGATKNADRETAPRVAHS